MTPSRLAFLFATIAAALPLTTSAQRLCRSDDMTLPPRAGDSSHWTQPRLLWRAFNDSASVHPHRVASDARQIVVTSEFVIADTSLRRRREPTAPLALRLDRRTGRITEIRKPHPTWSYTGTHVAIDGAGVAHLVWSETAGVTVPDLAGGRNAVQIWASRIVDDSVTMPELVVAAPSLQWGYDATSQSLRVDAAGRLYAVVLADPLLSRRPLMTLRLAGTRWLVERPDLGRLFHVTAVSSAVAGEDLHVVFTSPNRLRSSAAFGSVFHTSAPLGASRWSPPTQVHDADSTGVIAQFPAVSITPTGEVRAIWTLPVDGTRLFGRLDLLVASRAPGSPTFGPPHKLSPRAWLHDIQSVWTNRCGVTLVHSRTGAVGSTGASTLLEWDGRAWIEYPALTFNWQYLGRSLVTAPTSGELVRIWSSAFYGPGLPMILFWYTSDLRVGLPSR